MPVQSSDINQIPLLKSLSPETHQALSERFFKKDISSGQTLLVEGMTAENGYFLCSGALRVIRMNSEGRIQVLARITPGAPTNIISLLTPEKINRATIEALRESTVLILSARDLGHLLSHFPDFTEKLLRVFAERMALITDLAAGLSLHTVKTRLACFLMELAENPESAGGWTQDEIAAHIGTVRDVIGRLLREFEAEGLIQRDRHTIILLDWAGLSALAGE